MARKIITVALFVDIDDDDDDDVDAMLCQVVDNSGCIYSFDIIEERDVEDDN